MSIFYDEENPAAPVVIYIPNQFEVSTLDLDYDKQEFTGVVNSIETAVVQHAQTFKRALAYLIKNISDTKKAPKITLGKNKKVIQENQKDPTSKITQESLLIEP